jgi:protein TonB
MANLLNIQYQRVALGVSLIHFVLILIGIIGFGWLSTQKNQVVMMAEVIERVSTNISMPTLKKNSTEQKKPTDLPKTISNTPSSDPRVTENKAGSEGAAPVSMPNAHAKGLNNPKPPYPPVSRRLNEQGTVLLNVCVTRDGQVEKLKLEKSSNFDRLDLVALETVKKWQFIPAKKGNEAVAMCYLLPIQFTLEK